LWIGHYLRLIQIIMNESAKSLTKEHQREFLRQARLLAMEKGEYHLSVREAASKLRDELDGANAVETAAACALPVAEQVRTPASAGNEYRDEYSDDGGGAVTFGEDDAYTGCFDDSEEVRDDPGDVVFDESDAYTGCFEDSSDSEPGDHRNWHEKQDTGLEGGLGCDLSVAKDHAAGAVHDSEEASPDCGLDTDSTLPQCEVPVSADRQGEKIKEVFATTDETTAPEVDAEEPVPDLVAGGGHCCMEDDDAASCRICKVGCIVNFVLPHLVAVF
jgi:hypothetical protein